MRRMRYIHAGWLTRAAPKQPRGILDYFTSCLFYFAVKRMFNNKKRIKTLAVRSMRKMQRARGSV